MGRGGPGRSGHSRAYHRAVSSCSRLSTEAWSGVARVARADEVVEEVSAGSAALPDGPPCSADLRFQAGSISKLLLAAVVLRLHELHQLALDEPIGRRWRDTPEQWPPITLRQLIGQTSGLGHWGEVPGLGTRLVTAPPSREELLTMIARAPLLAGPGERWAYSGPGFLVAALVVEAATGDEYGAVAHELVLGPAGMSATTSGVVPDLRAGTALGHRDGVSLPVHPGFAALPGTGDLWTTVGDLISLAQSLRDGRVLGAEAPRLLWTAHRTLPAAAAAAAVDDDDDDDDGRLVTTHAYGYGYGMFLGGVAGSPARLSPGDNPGYQSLLAYLPDADLDVAVLCNDDACGVEAALSELACLRPRPDR